VKIKNIIDWLKESNRWKHLVGGFVLGLFLTFISPITAAGCLEFKDVQWGGRWEWLDFALTCIGGILGGAINMIIIYLLLLR